jgi:hypothetical protein
MTYLHFTAKNDKGSYWGGEFSGSAKKCVNKQFKLGATEVVITSNGNSTIFTNGPENISQVEIDRIQPIDKSPEVIAEFTDWLSHPLELGHAPKEVKIIKRYIKVVPPYNEFKPVPIYLCGWTDVDGSIGRGFVGPATWAFMGNVNDISNDDLVTCYCGWSTIFTLINSDGYQNITKCDCENKILSFLQTAMVSDIEIDERYRIGDSEMLSIKGRHDNEEVRIAITDDMTRVFFKEGMPLYNLPPLYYLVGNLVQKFA